MMQIAKDFFSFPEEERLKSYSDDPNKATRLSTSFNIQTEKVANWRDFLRLRCYPLEDYVHEWPTNPSMFRAHVKEYCTIVRGLALELVEAISESLGLERDYIGKQLGKHEQHMALNYYPPCPQPDLTYAQVLSNDKYKSILHRAVVNCDKERISIPTFYCPSRDAMISPAPQLVTKDQPAVYRPFRYGEYYDKFLNRGLATENCLDMFMATKSTRSA
ncbi:2-oxoglutarate (2OG) and Fe(II)-dependent oxygenase superfamily protein [Artemisia annua]|uniref:2-oxoglutarate (2OG) and Fe(II)-dependent oxygenase superfamily protein n=1 Tax=Artemisia annua TaxID=35608 RepID=A0A2U1P8W4_ARTAN|nr:2-oxoglutarate (2OG) and Fe(II)-dependent oxygenase superfamily protein [Artemisia annua]